MSFQVLVVMSWTQHVVLFWHYAYSRLPVRHLVITDILDRGLNSIENTDYVLQMAGTSSPLRDSY